MIKVSEIFYSLQGEGLYVGTPSIFIRFFGCNMKCEGFGMPRGQKSTERLEVDPSKYEKYEDLPLVKTGCDSYASWDPRFGKFAQVMDEKDIVNKIQSLLPGGKFGTNIHLIFTGGEPLLPAFQRKIPDILAHIEHRDMDLCGITFETNGTQELDDHLRYYLLDRRWTTTFSVSSKLSISGEPWEKAINPSAVRSYYYSDNRSQIFFKWVVENTEDLNDVKKAIETYDMPMFPVYLMPVGGTDDMYSYTKQDVAKIALDNGWRFSPRMQIDLWGNKWGT